MLCVSLSWCFNTVFIWLFKPVISDLEYDSMKATLTRIYSSTTSASQLEPVKMKPEQDFFVAQSDHQENNESPVLWAKRGCVRGCFSGRRGQP